MTDIPLHEKRIAIRDACVKANPEITELKPGCEVIIKSGVIGPATYVVIHAVARPATNGDEDSMIQAYEKDRPWRQGRFSFRAAVEEVVGRPIRLADVFWAMLSDRKTIDLGGFSNIVISWDLPRDDLARQTKETVDSVHQSLDL